MTRKPTPMALIVGLLEAADDAESVDALLEELVASGRISGERADVIRAQVQSGERTALDQLWVHSYEEEWGKGPRLEQDSVKGISCQGYGRRMGDIFGVDGQRIAHAVAQAYAGPYSGRRDIRDYGIEQDGEGKVRAR